MIKRLTIERCPKILVVQLKRFDPLSRQKVRDDDRDAAAHLL